MALAIALLVGLALGGVVGAAIDSSTGTAAPAPSVTTTVTTQPEVGEGGGTEAPEPEPEPTTEEPAAWNPKPKDFKIGLKVLKKQCFGSAGCSITFRITPSYVGSQTFPNKGRTEVTYVVTGGEDDITNTFEIDSEGTAHFEEEEFVDTASSSKKLVAKATEVEYNEFG